MSKRLDRIWADPVWSQLIAWAIIGTIGIIWAIVSSLSGDETFLGSIAIILDKSIKLKWIMLAFLFGAIVVTVIKIRMPNIELQLDQVEYSEENKLTDKKLFNRIKNEFLPSDGTLAYIHHQDFSGSYLSEHMEDLRRFDYESDKPEIEFIHPELNNILKDFIKNNSDFLIHLAKNTFHIDNPNIDAYRVPAKWIETHPEKWRKVTAELNDMADAVYAGYENLIQAGRRIIGDN